LYITIPAEIISHIIDDETPIQEVVLNKRSPADIINPIIIPKINTIGDERSIIGIVSINMKTKTPTLSITNTSTQTVVNSSTGTNVTGTANLRNCVLTITTASSSTDTNASFNAANYTVTKCSIVKSAQGNFYNNTVWNITGSYSFNENDATNVLQNVSRGAGGFFNNTSGIFNILFVIVIIGAISIVIAVVTRYGSGGSLGGTPDVGGSSVGVGKGGFRFGGKGGSSGTVMGV